MSIEKVKLSKPKTTTTKKVTSGKKSVRKKGSTGLSTKAESKPDYRVSQADSSIPLAVTQSSQSVYWSGLLIIGFGLGMGGYQYFHPARIVDLDTPLFETGGGTGFVARASGPIAEPERLPASEPETTDGLPVEKGRMEDSFARASALPVGERIEYWSSHIQKNSEVREDLMALTANEQVNDFQPIISRRLNSQTFVEIIAALSRSETSDEFAKNLISLRYQDGKAETSNRNFFPDVDWIPVNTRAGLITDITSEIASAGGFQIQTEKSKVDRNKWMRLAARKKGQFKPLSSGIQDGEVAYIPISQMQKLIGSLPHGALLSLVHQSDSDHPGLITQQGYVIKEGDKVLFRRVTLNGKVSTDELGPYLQKIEQQSRKKWPLAGVNLIQINPSNSTRSRLSDSL